MTRTCTTSLIAMLALSLGSGCPAPGDGYGYGYDDDDDAAYDDDDGWDDDDDDGPADDDDTPWEEEDDGSDEPPLEDDDDTSDDDDSADDSAPQECDGWPEEPVAWYLSADDSNSQADATHLRQLIQQDDQYPHALRPWEFLNYYDFAFEPAAPDAVRLVPQLRPVDGKDGAYSLLVGVVGPAMTTGDRPRLNVTFSVDTSCSMTGGGIGMARESMHAVASSLREGDVVSMVRWDTGSSVVLDSRVVSGPEDPVLTDAIDDLSTGGSTDLNQGLVAAYTLAEANYAPEQLNRVILISDGGANTGVTDEQLIAGHADDAEEEAIYLVGVGTPPADEYNDLLMDTVTDAGKGAYFYVDRPDEAERAFGPGRLEAALAVAARDVQLELTLPPGFVIERFDGEDKSTDASEVDPQHLAPNDAMLYHLVLLGCVEENIGDSEFGLQVTWEDPITREPRSTAQTVTLDELLAGPADELRKAEAILLYVDAMQEMWSLEYSDRGAYLDDVYEQLSAASAAAPDDPDLAEVLALVGLVRSRY